MIVAIPARVAMAAAIVRPGRRVVDRPTVCGVSPTVSITATAISVTGITVGIGVSVAVAR